MRISLPVAKVLRRPVDEVVRPIHEAGPRLLRKEPEPKKSRPAEVNLDDYEMTPFGRRPKRKGRRKLMIGLSVLGVVAAAAWVLL